MQNAGVTGPAAVGAVAVVSLVHPTEVLMALTVAFVPNTPAGQVMVGTAPDATEVANLIR
jgi:hypothetical protein